MSGSEQDAKYRQLATIANELNRQANVAAQTACDHLASPDVERTLDLATRAADLAAKSAAAHAEAAAHAHHLPPAAQAGMAEATMVTADAARTLGLIAAGAGNAEVASLAAAAAGNAERAARELDAAGANKAVANCNAIGARVTSLAMKSFGGRDLN